MVMIAQMKDKEHLKAKVHQAVCQLYQMVSTHPSHPFHFPVGKEAARGVGYPERLLRSLPTMAVESFAGVGYHFQNDVIKRGMKVLDIGSGSGTDLLVAAGLVGPKGRVVGIDITKPMMEKAKKATKSNGFKNVSVILADAESLPFKDASFDVVISNGVINLIVDKEKVFREIGRVLKPGGFLSLADIVLGKRISEQSRQDPQLWAECIVGALPEDQYVKVIRNAGFKNITIVDSFSYFDNSPSKNTREVADYYKAHTIVLNAERGGEQ